MSPQAGFETSATVRQEVSMAQNPVDLTNFRSAGNNVGSDHGRNGLDLVIGLHHLTHVRVLTEEGCQGRSVKTSNA